MKKFFVLVVLLCTVMISSTAAAANWVWIYSDSRFTIYVDNDSIRRDYNYSGYVFRAFVKWIYNDKGRNIKIEQRRAKGLSIPREMYNLSHCVSLEYFKVVGGMKYSAEFNSIYYTHDGITIPELEYSPVAPQWDLITPDSIGEAEFDAVYARVPN